MSFRSLRGVLLPAVVALGCGDDTRPPQALPVSANTVDSAGVRVVTTPIPADGLPVYGTVSLEPEVDIDVSGGGASLALVKGARTLSDGTIVVGDEIGPSLRAYTPSGQLLWSTNEVEGRRLRSIALLGADRGARVWTFDSGLRVLIWVDGAGVTESSAVPGGGSLVGRFGDGSFLMVPGWSLDRYRADSRMGLRRDTATYLRWWPDEGRLQEVGAFPHDEVMVLESEEGDYFGVPPFGRRTSRAVGPGRLYVGDQSTFEIRGYDPDGTWREAIRLDGFDLTFDSAQVSAARSARVRADSAAAAWPDAVWEPSGGMRPAYTRLLLDGAGNLWVAEHVATVGPPRYWMVFGPDGVVRGLVEVPPRFVPFEIGPTHLLGTTVDAEGRARVRRYGYEVG